jgi:putative FmdB family regulatory protein
MPIYEFLCEDCATVFNFYTPTANTDKVPVCPKCRQRELKRLLSPFALVSHRQSEAGDELPFDEARMEKALQIMENEMDNVKEDDPRQMASLLRKMTEAAGGNLDGGLEEALTRMEAGEDPEAIEEEMGDALNPDTIFSGGRKRGQRAKKLVYDDTLYDL